MRALTLSLALTLSVACASRQSTSHRRPQTVTLSIVGTNDLHGRIAMLPWLAGHVENLRRVRARDGGAVVLVDAGDMFQGTLESNLEEGASVVRAYNALGYQAATIGNHEFDYGPAGEATFARIPNDDPQGALRLRASEAHFPFLTANIVEASNGAPVSWSNVRPSAVVTAAGVRVGLIGVSTESTPHTTLTVNFRGLAMRPLADTIRSRADELRAQGATVIVVLAHAGGSCRHFNDPDDLSSCDANEEIFEVARALPEGAVDAIVAGHTHRGVAHVVHGIPVLESFANGQAFGRIDLTVETATGRVLRRHVFAPHNVCGRNARDEPDPDSCAPEEYEGLAVSPDSAMRSTIAPAIEAARSTRERPLHVRVDSPVRSRYREESALTNLVADMMRAASQGADVALMNSGGVRTDLNPGDLDYGQLYSVLPFDNRLVRVRVRGSGLREIIARDAQHDSGVLGLSGVRAEVRCERGHAVATVTRDDGRPIADDEVLTLATNDYLAGGSLSRQLAEPLTDDAIVASPPLRDAVATTLATASPLRGDDARWYDPAHPRVRLPSARPVHCP